MSTWSLRSTLKSIAKSAIAPKAQHTIVVSTNATRNTTVKDEPKNTTPEIITKVEDTPVEEPVATKETAEPDVASDDINEAPVTTSKIEVVEAPEAEVVEPAKTTKTDESEAPEPKKEEPAKRLTPKQRRELAQQFAKEARRELSDETYAEMNRAVGKYLKTKKVREEAEGLGDVNSPDVSLYNPKLTDEERYLMATAVHYNNKGYYRTKGEVDDETFRAQTFAFAANVEAINRYASKRPYVLRRKLENPDLPYWDKAACRGLLRWRELTN